MAIANCSNCKRSYWRFRKDHPPARYCSVSCFETRKKRHDAEEPDTPEEVLWEMRNHRRTAHGDTSMLGWYECQTCFDLEHQYREAVDYHISKANKSIALDAKQKRGIETKEREQKLHVEADFTERQTAVSSVVERNARR